MSTSSEVAPAAAGGIFFNSGQICVAGSRLFAHRSVFDRVVEGVAAASAFWKPRPSLDPEAHMGPLVSREQMDRVMGYIEAGKRDGASVVVGGDAAAADGYYVNPTVLVNVKPSMSIVREEIFGPVLVAQRFDSLDEVAKAANDTAYGLAASVWTKDVSAMHQPGRQTQSRHRLGQLPRGDRSGAAVRRLQAVGHRPRAGPSGHRGLHGAEDGHHQAVGIQSAGSGAHRRRPGGCDENRGEPCGSPLFFSVAGNHQKVFLTVSAQASGAAGEPVMVPAPAPVRSNFE